MKNWSKEICVTQPEELQIVAPGIYLQRRNIKAVVHEATDDEAEYTDYECESREITESEYAMLKSVEEIDTAEDVQAAIDDYTAQLVEGGIL